MQSPSPRRRVPPPMLWLCDREASLRGHHRFALWPAEHNCGQQSLGKWVHFWRKPTWMCCLQKSCLQELPELQLQWRWGGGEAQPCCAPQLLTADSNVCFFKHFLCLPVGFLYGALCYGQLTAAQMALGSAWRQANPVSTSTAESQQSFINSRPLITMYLWSYFTVDEKIYDFYDFQ